jgi:hypothetical protein
MSKPVTGQHNPKRSIRSNRLLMDLILNGRNVVCEVSGCGCADPTELEIHHIMPVSSRPIHSPDNLAILCRSHHALVERFYWWQRSKLMPDECREARSIALMFRHRTVPFGRLDELEARTKQLWGLLAAHPNSQNFMWWRSVFAKAKTWAAGKDVVRRVEAKDAITEDPWFRANTRKTGAVDPLIMDAQEELVM